MGVDHREEPLTYSASGVDIGRGEEAVRRIAPLALSTRTPGVVTDVGGFAGLFAGSFPGTEDPLLSAATDGVGTKLMVAFALDRHDTVGIDCVAMCVNDILVQGARPLFFLDYLAMSAVDPDLVEQIVSGVAAGCRRAGCALLGGETAEMPGLYRQGEYDLVGFSVGMVCRSRVVDGSRIQPGDALVGLASSGIHSNGFSLARRALLDRAGYRLDADPNATLGRSLGEELLEPTRIYVRPVLELLEHVQVKGMAHITGGGLPGNIPRTLPAGLSYSLRQRAWPIHPVFELIQQAGDVAESEMMQTFNMGIGMVLVVGADEAEAAVGELTRQGETAYVIGEVVPG